MQFPFNERKAAQAAAYILQRHGGTFDYYSLIKLLYLADRTALIESGVPVTGDTMVSLPKGPILSSVKNCLTGDRECGAIWAETVSQRDDENVVTLATDSPRRDELCEYEIEVLERIYKKYGSKSGGELWAICHALPEHKDPGTSARRILPEEILVLENVPEARISEFAEHAAMLMRAAELGGRGL